MSTISATDLRAAIDRELTELVALRHDLHAHPELAYEERRTSEVVRRELAAAGVEAVGDLAGGTGVLGHLPGASDNVVGLRADMDALPIEEETGAAYASTIPGTMHACGHDGHTTILIGAARVLAGLAKAGTLPHPVTFCFQPAEEGGAGGRRMVEDGCLDGSVIGPPVRRIYGLHGWTKMALGRVGTRPGPLLAAADMFEIELVGRGAHAAMPHLGRDPIVAASALVQALHTIVSRNVDPLDHAVLSVTKLHGGTAHNIIPERVTLGGTVRTFDPAIRAIVIERMQDVIDSVAAAHGCRAVFTFHDGYPVTRNDPDAAAFVSSTLTDAFGAERYEPVPRPFMGGEDFSYYGEHVPACFFLLGLCPDGATMADLHHPKFDFNDDAIAVGVEAFCRLALRDD